MHDIVEVSDLPILPQHGDILQLVDLHTLSRYSLGQNRVNLISELLIKESEVVGLVSDDFKANLDITYRLPHEVRICA